MESYREEKSNLPIALLSGCTANVILITDEKIYTANCGDSRAAMLKTSSSRTYVELSEDHKPENEREKARIERGGGFVKNSRVNGNLNLSRALGDFYYKRDKNLEF